MDFAITHIKELGVPVGTIAVTPEQARHFADLGVSFLAFGADTAFLAQSADNALATFKKSIEE
jgi:4-hydroxy-2-oxoheptanedioate aldolase/2-dehydro-3-deoxy-L-rhamnonate aldolase